MSGQPAPAAYGKQPPESSKKMAGQSGADEGRGDIAQADDAKNRAKKLNPEAIERYRKMLEARKSAGLPVPEAKTKWLEQRGRVRGEN